MKEIKKQLEAARQAYLAIVHTAVESEVMAASARVKALMNALSEAIASGAKDCCGQAPHGMEQPTQRGTVEYEVRCLKCGNSTRGGLLPRHTVEAWNERLGG